MSTSFWLDEEWWMSTWIYSNKLGQYRYFFFKIASGFWQQGIASLNLYIFTQTSKFHTWAM